MELYKADEWELKREDIILENEIGRGTFGKVDLFEIILNKKNILGFSRIWEKYSINKWVSIWRLCC
jgi:hypothetical protein